MARDNTRCQHLFNGLTQPTHTMPATTPEAISRRKERDRIRMKEYHQRPEVKARHRLRERERARVAKAGKPPKRAKLETPGRVHLVIAPSPRRPPSIAGKRWSEQLAIVPPGVRVQKLPGCPKESRFTPPSGFRGEWSAEWNQLRSA